MVHYLLELLKFMSIESVMLSNHLILCCPLLLSLLSFPASALEHKKKKIASRMYGLQLIYVSILFSSTLKKKICIKIETFKEDSLIGDVSSQFNRLQQESKILQEDIVHHWVLSIIIQNLG